MQPNEYQDLTKDTEIYSEAATSFLEDTLGGEREHFLKIAYCTIKLNGEAGEIAEKVGKVFRSDQGLIGEDVAYDLAKELGDVLWYVARLADLLDWTLEDVMQMNITKLKDRKARNVISGSGDER